MRNDKGQKRHFSSSRHTEGSPSLPIFLPTFSFTLSAVILLSLLCIDASRILGGQISVQAQETIKKEEKDWILVLDPGHGGSQPGAEENGVQEKDLNLTIAKYLKEILEKDYENIKVSLTRDDDYDLALKKRVQIAADRDAHMLISLHNNARGDNFEYKDGCTVLTAQGHYKPELAKKEQDLACCILSELEKLGLENRGILLRDSETGDSYEDGSVADYYAIIRAGINLDVPSVIVEHAFMDEEEDFQNHLSTDSQLKELAQADARGIAAYLRLKPKEGEETPEPPSNYEVTIYHLYDDNPEHTKKSKKIFFPTQDREEGERTTAAAETTEITEITETTETTEITNKKKQENRPPDSLAEAMQAYIRQLMDTLRNHVR